MYVFSSPCAAYYDERFQILQGTAWRWNGDLLIYVHHCASFEGKTPLPQTLSQIKRDIILAGENTLDINEASVKAWQRWEDGYACVTSFHRTDKRTDRRNLDLRWTTGSYGIWNLIVTN